MKSTTVKMVRTIEVPGLGDRIREARKESGQSVDRLCDQVGVSRTYWYDIENGALKGSLSLENLRAIEQVLGVNFGVAIGDSNE